MSNFIETYFHTVTDALSSLEPGIVQALTEEIFKVWERRGTIYIMGNGGSAATASHFACDLSKLTISKNLQRVKAMALTDNMSILTAWANDTHYEHVFMEQLVPFLEPDDLVLVISASGNSPNVIQALKYAKSVGAKTASLSGFQGGEVSLITDYPVVTWSDSMQVIEDSHSLLCHGIALEICQMMTRVQLEAITTIGG
ncbi:SIS domain-containing protein [Paenibacillus hexagrammi]|uniref:SIS domain-containing protein n=1 Tax=Paenibacillus hexagrammi TaxID=2908839 RepID=A0ABY3SF95_9BACL|nr:SIS domain-containing protein [Paenibacillus sp. YPD9-1]UJF31861.1 SIS domain-containing protein [Paenibacillus sp. YPD9-1]